MLANRSLFCDGICPIILGLEKRFFLIIIPIRKSWLLKAFIKNSEWKEKEKDT
jgi:hypothetical protein